MNAALWSVAGWLTAAYLVSGIAKLVTPQKKLAAIVPAAEWVMDFSPGALKAIGAVEILGAAGLILPALLDIAPVLAPLAAVGLALVMTGAVIVRVRRHELKYALLDMIYLALAVFVAVGRFGPESFTS